MPRRFRKGCAAFSLIKPWVLRDCEQVITIVGFYTVKRTAEFDDWRAGVKDGLTRIRLAKRLDKVQRGLLGNVEPVGEGVS